MPFQDLIDMLKQKQDQSNDMIGNQVALMRKKLANNDYNPSPDEQANQDKYYDSVTGAVAGSIAPEAPELGILDKEKQAAAALNNVYNKAAQAADTGVVSQGADAISLAREAAKNSRALDMADRYRSQIAARKFQGIRGKVGQ